MQCGPWKTEEGRRVWQEGVYRGLLVVFLSQGYSCRWQWLACNRGGGVGGREGLHAFKVWTVHAVDVVMTTS